LYATKQGNRGGGTTGKGGEEAKEKGGGKRIPSRKENTIEEHHTRKTNAEGTKELRAVLLLIGRTDA
jgi:hypothetical protein